MPKFSTLIAAAAVVALVAAAPGIQGSGLDQPAPPAGNVGDRAVDNSSGDDRSFTSASCDQNDTAFDVEPDTDAARTAATDWCLRSGQAIDNAPWPSGFKPVPLDDVLHP